jgi:uncharacterized protein
MTTKWKTLNNEPIEDITEFVSEAIKAGQPLHIGTDSLQTGRYTQFVTVVVILNPPHGGRVAYLREVMPKIASLRKRLNDEVWRSVGVAMEMPEIADLTVHIDANTEQKHMSSRYLQELVGLVVGQGFKALWKPDSWASTHVADHIVRHRSERKSTSDTTLELNQKATA